MADIKEYGEVVKIKGDTALVKFHRSSACGKCNACGMLSNQNEIVVEVQNSLNASVGEHVAVNITANKALKASALAYLFPLLMLILGAFVGWLLSSVWGVFSDQSLTMALCAVVFALLSFLLLKIASPLYNKTVSNVYTMVGKKETKYADNEKCDVMK